MKDPIASIVTVLLLAYPAILAFTINIWFMVLFPPTVILIAAIDNSK